MVLFRLVRLVKLVKRIALQSAVFLVLAVLFASSGRAQQIVLKGLVTDPAGRGLPDVTVEVLSRKTLLSKARSNQDGAFEVTVPSSGEYSFRAEGSGFEPTIAAITIHPVGNPQLSLRLTQIASASTSVTVTADINDLDVLSPDPAEKVFVRQDLLDANPGRPGAPVSIPGYPIETASSGIKAPQYFAPGVAGDHGEPIAQYIQVGSYLVPNNLSANAHGNGYADPNLFIPEILESVQVDGGAFNVRQGNHAVNLAAVYGLRSRLDPFATLTADYRDLDLVAGMSPTQKSFLAVDLSYGNGFLKRLEHRQQYKLNSQRIYDLANHRLTLLGIAYYGFSYIPGLVPIYATDADDADFPNYGDTIDPRQRDQTHTALLALNDVWRLTSAQQLQLSGFFRTYNLSLYSDFGGGLIRQSEFRTVAGSSANYVNKISEAVSFLGGFDWNREAPRRDNLDHYSLPNPATPRVYGPFNKVDSNNVTLTSLTPYAAASGALSPYIRYYAGWRRDQIDIANQDLLNPANSFQKWVGLNSPKATLSLLPRQSWYLPQLSLSYGQAFFTEDPRIGTGSAIGTPVATAHSYQLVASKTLAHTDVKITLGHVTTSQELAKIDPDTGLQEDEGPGRLKFLTAVVRHNFSQGSILATFSKADARDIDSGDPTPEAPRTLFDLLGNAQKLPFGLKARGEFELVGRKTLGTGCAPDPDAQCLGTQVREFRGAVVRPFEQDRMAIGVNMLFASGHTGQTLQTFYPSDIAVPSGVRIPSYASVNFTYKIRTSHHPLSPAVSLSPVVSSKLQGRKTQAACAKSSLSSCWS